RRSQHKKYPSCILPAAAGSEQWEKFFITDKFRARSLELFSDAGTREGMIG
ncbi:MAG: hypothetical protein RJB13_1993, partial [Pseudomonadota bacterium]